MLIYFFILWIDDLAIYHNFKEFKLKFLIWYFLTAKFKSLIKLIVIIAKKLYIKFLHIL